MDNQSLCIASSDEISKVSAQKKKIGTFKLNQWMDVDHLEITLLKISKSSVLATFPSEFLSTALMKPSTSA